MSSLIISMDRKDIVTVKDATGSHLKTMSVTSFINLLKALNPEAVDSVGRPISLPTSILTIAGSPALYSISMYFPEKEAVVRCSGTNYNIVLPNIVLEIDLTEGPGCWTITRTKWMMTDRSRVDYKPEYGKVLAMPNVYSSGSMCYGGNALPGRIYHDWTILDSLYHDVLLKSPFNNDLGVPGVGASADDWLKTLSDRRLNGDKFPYERFF